MSDLVDRLEKAYADIGQHYGYVACIDEAADEIGRLRVLARQINTDWIPANNRLSAENRLLRRLLQEAYDGRMEMMSVGLCYRIGQCLNHSTTDTSTEVRP
jgi:hypothetical protein